jgi:branched-chain amino acid transport system permease protein
LQLALQQLFNAASLASIYAMVALGITLVFGLTRLVNFAHGELLMLSAFIVYDLVVVRKVNFFIATLAAVAILILGNLILERLAFRPTLSSPLNGFLVSLGLVLVLQGIAIQLWGNFTRTLVPPFPGITHAGSIVLSNQRLFVIAVTIPILAAFFLFLRFHRTGVALRAAAVDPEVATWMGVPVMRMISVTFALGGALAALGGGLFVSLFPIDPFVGGTVVIKGFAVALIGGLGNVAGAVFASIILALVETLVSGYWLPEWSNAFAFAAIVLVLLFRPTGLFRGTEGATL